MRNSFRWIIALFLLLWAWSSEVTAQNSVVLTDQEREWIKAHPTLKVGNELDWAPFDFADDKEPLGYSIDFIRLVAAKVGLKLEFVNGYAWSELLNMLKTNKLDILPAIYVTDERKAFIAFTAKYFVEPSVIVVHRDNKEIKGFSDLSGKTLAAIKGYHST